MSGGHFDYKQWVIDAIADEVEGIIAKNGKPIPWECLEEYERRDYGYDERTYVRSMGKPLYYDFSPKVIDRFKEGLEILQKASVYANRIDWLLSGDDGEDSFLRRLGDALAKLDGEGGRDAED